MKNDGLLIVFSGPSGAGKDTILNHLLEKNPKKINRYNLSKNPNAIHLLEQNPYEIESEL